jgi:hypothetical protein
MHEKRLAFRKVGIMEAAEHQGLVPAAQHVNDVNSRLATEHQSSPI